MDIVLNRGKTLAYYKLSTECNRVASPETDQTCKMAARTALEHAAFARI